MARPSSVDQRRPSPWQSATSAPDVPMSLALCDDPEAITRHRPSGNRSDTRRIRSAHSTVGQRVSSLHTARVRSAPSRFVRYSFA